MSNANVNGIELLEARITAASVRIEEGQPMIRLRIVGIAEEALAIRLATSIAVPWVDEDVSKLLRGLAGGAVLIHEIPRIHTLKVRPKSVSKFACLNSNGDRTALISCVATITGQLFDILEHMMRIGEGAGRCWLHTAQAGLFDKTEVT